MYGGLCGTSRIWNYWTREVECRSEDLSQPHWKDQVSLHIGSSLSILSIFHGRSFIDSVSPLTHPFLTAGTTLVWLEQTTTRTCDTWSTWIIVLISTSIPWDGEFARGFISAAKVTCILSSMCCGLREGRVFVLYYQMKASPGSMLHPSSAI